MKSEFNTKVEELEEIIRVISKNKQINAIRTEHVFSQVFKYLDNEKRVQEKNEYVEEFNIERFKKIDSKKKTDYYKFKKPNDKSMTDIVYKVYTESPTTYGLLTKDSSISFGLDLMLSVANDNHNNMVFTKANQINGKKLIDLVLIIDKLPIFLLHVDDIECMRMDWIRAMKEIIENYQSNKMDYNFPTDDDYFKEHHVSPLRYLFISDLSLIYRPNIDVKLTELSKESNVNIIAFVNE